MTPLPLLACPSTGRALSWSRPGHGGPVWTPRPRPPGAPAPIGVTEQLVVRADGSAAYPVVDGVPALLAPEVLLPHEAGEVAAVDLSAPAYAEAYAEMSFYNVAAVESPELAGVVAALDGLPAVTFPHDPRWIDAPYDGHAQADCYRALGSVQDAVTLQIGGAGLHAVKFLLAGARTAVLVTPMITEALRARWLAERAGVADRLVLALGVAEELPLADGGVDAAFTGGCMHHMVFDLALPRIRRALGPGGVFAAAEPWRAPLYAVGTSVLGKRESGTQCRPLTPDDLDVFARVFDEPVVTHHGALTRYPLLALSKVGIRPRATTLLDWFARDDRWSDRLGLRRHGSSISCVGRASHDPAGAAA